MRVRGLSEPKTTAAPPLCLRRVSAISYTLFILKATTAERGVSFDKFFLGKNVSLENRSRVEIFILGKSLNNIL